MIVLNEAFHLAQEPQFSRAAQGLSVMPWLVFEGPEALTLAQFCHGKKRDRQPCLIIECARPGKGSYFYEGVKIQGISHTSSRALISGKIDETMYGFTLHPTLISSEDGLTLTKITTLPEFFPMQEYLAFRNQKLNLQAGVNPQPRAR